MAIRYIRRKRVSGIDVVKGQDARWYDPANDNYVGFKSPALSGNLVFTWPEADASDAGWVLGSDGAGNLNWKLRVVLNLNRSAYELTTP